MKTPGIDLAGLDRSTPPCRDFWQFANGGWLAHNPIPADRPAWSGIGEIVHSNLDLLREIAEEAARATQAPRGSALRLVGAFYRSGMDGKSIEAAGARPLGDELARIAAVRDVPSLQAELASLQRQTSCLTVNSSRSPLWLVGAAPDPGNSGAVIVWLSQAGLGLPDRDAYLCDDDGSAELRRQYRGHVARMLELLGDARPEAGAATIVEMETRLARASMTAAERRDPKATYHKMRLADLDALTPGAAWGPYFAALGLPDPGEINVAQPEFIREAAAMMRALSAADWRTYLRWQLIHATAGLLSTPFVAEDFNFNRATLLGAKQPPPRWRSVLERTDEQLGHELGQLFVARAFSPAAKARALALAVDVKAALRERLLTLDWIGQETRRQAVAKLDAMSIKIGYPDKWRDSSGLALDRGSFAGNVMQTNAFEFQRRLGRVGKPVDRGEWQMTPPTVNAYYDTDLNEVAFPAGFLQPPLFDERADDAANYGAIGTWIAHEMTHGFDDAGRQYDALGNLANWWSAEDETRFKARAVEVEKQFDEYVAVDSLHVDGRLTLGENLADLGGLKLGYLALARSLAGKARPPAIDGFTPEQRFFLAFAQSRRASIRPEALRVVIRTDPHAPPRWRVIGPLSNLPEFAASFGCCNGDPMVRPAGGRAGIW